jgi:hypothetical protein
MTAPPDAIPASHATQTGLPTLIADVYAEAPLSLRARLLSSLLRPVGPLALVAIAAGAFARLLPTAPRWQGAGTVTAEDASRIQPEDVFELARYVQQKSPEALLQLPDLLRENALLINTISVSVLLMALRTL